MGSPLETRAYDEGKQVYDFVVGHLENAGDGLLGLAGSIPFLAISGCVVILSLLVLKYRQS